MQKTGRGARSKVAELAADFRVGPGHGGDRDDRPRTGQPQIIVEYTV